LLYNTGEREDANLFMTNYSIKDINWYCHYRKDKHLSLISTLGAVVVVIVWQLDLQLRTQSVHIATDVDQGEVYNIM